MEVQEGDPHSCNRTTTKGHSLPLPATGLSVSISCAEGPWSLPERSWLPVLLHLLMWQELEITGTGRELKGCHFSRSENSASHNLVSDSRGLPTEPVTCPLNTVSPSIADKILQFPAAAAIDVMNCKKRGGSFLQGDTLAKSHWSELEYTEWI